MGASITIHRLVEWVDTDAGGHYHNQAVIRWTEAAEAELHRNLGIAARTFGSTPRVRIEFDFRQPLWFLDVAEIELTVDHVGRSSCRCAVVIRNPQGETAAEGSYVVAYVPSSGAGAVPWPDDIRAALEGGPD